MCKMTILQRIKKSKKQILTDDNASEKLAKRLRFSHSVYSFNRDPFSGNKFPRVKWNSHAACAPNSQGGWLPPFFRLATLAHSRPCFSVGTLGVLLQTPGALEPSSRVIRSLFAYLRPMSGVGKCWLWDA